MGDKEKSKEQLIAELHELRQRVARLQESENQLKGREEIRRLSQFQESIIDNANIWLN